VFEYEPDEYSARPPPASTRGGGGGDRPLGRPEPWRSTAGAVGVPVRIMVFIAERSTVGQIYQGTWIVMSS
jgi:hypothetical protein